MEVHSLPSLKKKKKKKKIVIINGKSSGRFVLKTHITWFFNILYFHEFFFNIYY